MPVDMVRDIASIVEGKGLYINLNMDFGCMIPDDRVCPMDQIRIPVSQFRWNLVGRPGGYRHINVEESAAGLWSLHDRLLRPSEFGHRVVQLGDSTSCVGASKKGRSSSLLLNAKQRQRWAVTIAGDFEVFDAWISTSYNPSDEPSSWYVG